MVETQLQAHTERHAREIDVLREAIQSERTRGTQSTAHLEAQAVEARTQASAIASLTHETEISKLAVQNSIDQLTVAFSTQLSSINQVLLTLASAVTAQPPAQPHPPGLNLPHGFNNTPN